LTWQDGCRTLADSASSERRERTSIICEFADQEVIKEFAGGVANQNILSRYTGSIEKDTAGSNPAPSAIFSETNILRPRISS
jgi:hypothetical protein